jgi:hypothetical protein
MSAPSASPLDEDQVRILTETRARGRKLRLASGIALVNVISMGLFALFSLLFDAVSLSLSPFALALALLTYNEWRGRRQLLALEPRAPFQLAQNQLLLLLLVAVYCAWNAYSAWVGPDPLAALASGELGDTLDQMSKQMDGNLSDLGNWARVASLLVYSAVLATSAVVQGLTALYYRSLQPTLEALARAPSWARALD